ncbi:putative glycosyltransferase STELLO2 [Planktothrix tepida]|uniref:DUF288 domain-containing protein n=1 Tax=Planktothrix tepida PCC 9214 TaxID=671072 RepID=A0A1J1LQB8_9CYAN|nr:STELLO glycosyltransferase family protein [Planktothrix tepida]CAD5961626.1 putative glycosyltransferase STELLO2 [Planktothrix tepida]CUR34776.1 conserved hypothetical protein [Planktothrix tepida PCC 9214]
MMKAFVLTTINSPTDALFKYRDILVDLGWNIIIVGDKKTPSTFDVPGAEYLSIDQQYDEFGEIASLIPANHYARKTLGYLYALKKGAEIIAESDDDNIPYADRYPNFVPSQVKTPIIEARGVYNVYSYFTSQKIWPRGLPLDAIKNKIDQTLTDEKEVTCYVQQGLADLDPDVDAIYRLTASEAEIIFDSGKKLALGAGCYTPFNTQNTLFYKPAFPLMLLPIGVHSRVTDIWRGYIAQRLLWCMDSAVLFLSPSVYQLRNEHNLLKDFEAEVPLYTDVKKFIDLLESFSSESRQASELMVELYSHLYQHQFLSEIDLKLCQLWSQEISKYMG